ncbi:flagellar protein FlaG [Thalassotalea euphylliae]|nr:flagellar protein FlaG [Thalassotalea euphylliae]
MESSISITRPVLDNGLSRTNDTAQREVTQRDLGNEIAAAEGQVKTNQVVAAEDIVTADVSDNGLDNSSREVEEAELSEALETVSSFIEPQIRNVNFTQDDSSGQTVIKVVDAQSQELIKQFPSDEILELAERIKGLQDEIADKTGILIDDKV